MLSSPLIPSEAGLLDVLGLGCTAVDDLLYVAAYPPADAKVQVLRREKQCGGLTARALLTSARLGGKCAFAGVLGEDADSRFVIDTFQQQQITTSFLVKDPQARPIRSTIIVDETRGTRNIFYDLSGSVGAHPQRPEAEVIRSTRVLLVDHYGVEGMTRAARIAQAAGIPVVGDLEQDAWPGFSDLFELVDHLVVCQAFAAKRTGEADPAAALRKLWGPARQAVVITAGAAGCWFLGKENPDQISHQPAFVVEVVDTTGCGDVFHGAYAYGLTRGWDLKERVRFSAAAAALKAAGTEIPLLPAVESLLRSR